MKFYLGEIAVYVGLVVDSYSNGRECEVIATGPFRRGSTFAIPGRFIKADSDSDYVVRDCEGYFFIDEKNLRKRRPPIPDEVLTIFQGSPAMESA